MKTVSAALKVHLASEVTTICTCWRITRRDGAVFRFTDHDVDLLVEGETYVAAVGYTRTAIAANADMSVDNMDVNGIFDDASITEADLRWQSNPCSVNSREAFPSVQSLKRPW